MKVKIIACTSASWYKNLVGEIISVDEKKITGTRNRKMYKVNDSYDRMIYVKNCVKISNAKIFPTLKKSYNFGD